MIESKLCERWSPEQIVGPELKENYLLKLFTTGCIRIFLMYQEKEKQRKLKKREENLILESQLVKDQKKSKKRSF